MIFINFQAIDIYKDYIQISGNKYPVKDLTLEREVQWGLFPNYGVFKYKNKIISKYYIWSIFSGNITKTDIWKTIEFIEELRHGKVTANPDIFINEKEENFIGIIIFIHVFIMISVLIFFALMR